jgi:hypothetical protein
VQDLKVRLYNCLEKESVTKDQQQPIAPIKDTAVISYESKKRKQEVLHYDAP